MRGWPFLVCVAACSGSGETSTPVAAKPPIEVTPANAPTTLQKSEDDCESTWSAEKLAASATAPFDAIDLQLDAAPTFGISRGLYGIRTFSRLVELTLYRDGRVFYPEHDEYPRKYLSAQLMRAEADELKARVLALGAEQLKSHVDECSCPHETPHGKAMVCTSDASHHVLRFRDHTDALRHIVVYGGFWNRPAIAEQIRDLLTKFRAPNEAPYLPDHATLVLVRSDSEKTCTGSLSSDLAKLEPKDSYLNVAALDGPTLRNLQTLAAGGEATWCNSPTTMHAFLYPWLPGADHRATIADFMRSMKATE